MNKTNYTKVGTYFYNDEPYNFNFATSLSMSEKITFINSIVDTIVDSNYNSILKDIMFDFMLVKIFTDIETSFLKVEDEYGNIITDIDLVEHFLEETNIVDIVKANMEIGLLEELNEAVNKAIEYRTGIHPSPLNDALASLIGTLEKKVNEIDLGGAMEMVKMFNGMADEFTPESVVNAYMNSDMHKKNLNEIAETKKTKKSKKSKNNEIKIDENLGEAIRAIVKESKAEN